MSSQQSKNRSSFPAAALAAFVLGSVLCPFVYVVIGALGEFESEISLFLLLLLLTSSGYLLFRFLSKPKESASGGVWRIAEILSWFVIAAFIVVASNIRIPFFTVLARTGFLFMFLLLASLLSLPVVLLRKTALQQRLMKLPNSVIVLLLVLVMSTSAAVIAVYLLTPNPVWR